MARKALASIAVLLASSSAALADPVFSNAAADTTSGSGREMTAWMQADDFHITSDTTVTGAAVEWFTLNRLTTWDHALNWYIFSDQGGAPGSLIAQGGGVNLLTEFGGHTNYDRYASTFDLNAPVFLAGGHTYWFGLHFANDFSRHDIYWADAVSSQLSAGMESYQGVMNNWANVSNMDRSFSMVPTPGAVSLAAAGALVLIRRKR